MVENRYMIQRRPKPIPARKKWLKLTLLSLPVLILISIVWLLSKRTPERTVNYDQVPLTLPITIQAPATETPAADVVLSEQKTTTPPPKKAETPWQTVVTKEKDSLSSVFKRLGLGEKTLQAVLHQNPHAKLLAQIKPNQQLRFEIQDNTLEQLVIAVRGNQLLTVFREGNRYTSHLSNQKITSSTRYVTAEVQGSLYATAKRFNIPHKLIQQMADIFKTEIDFSREVHTGDQFTILYKALFIENKPAGIGEILAINYTTHRGKTHSVIRHKNSQGEDDYFTPEGRSLRKAFLRYPIKFSHISSPFSLSRMHPVLHQRRPHKGIDLAAALGTPIMATGDGRIEKIGSYNGYGNMVKITHSPSHSTVYAHMLRFQKGLSKGSRVKRGQIIGYVGQTGLATGPHCHYEVHMNQQPRNPATLNLPRATSIAANNMPAFKNHVNMLLAQMKLHEEATFASVNQRTEDTA